MLSGRSQRFSKPARKVSLLCAFVFVVVCAFFVFRTPEAIGGSKRGGSEREEYAPQPPGVGTLLFPSKSRARAEAASAARQVRIGCLLWGAMWRRRHDGSHLAAANERFEILEVLYPGCGEATKSAGVVRVYLLVLPSFFFLKKTARNL